MQKTLETALLNAGINADTTSQVLESGYFLRTWGYSGQTWQSVSDMMYGNKQFSSSFEIDEFISHVKAENRFDPLPSFRRYKAKSIKEIREILSESGRSRLMELGKLSFRGQIREHYIKRKIPNPVRSDEHGRELSIMPGLYRQPPGWYSFNLAYEEKRSFENLRQALEPNGAKESWSSAHAYDPMRVEQHYATQTAGLDLSFDIETPLFFATHRFLRNDDGTATYHRIKRGEHEGVIYCFCFRDPPVAKQKFHIKDFDFYRTYRPERVIRQDCGLPLIGGYERNIATTDLDCIIELDADFSEESPRSAEWMFPGISQDAFYRKLLEIKDRMPKALPDLVEYEWARTT